MLKDTIALLLYQVVYWLVKLRPAKPGEKHLVLIKTDEIGDYMLIRDHLAYFRNASVFKDYTITFVGNALFQPLFEVYNTGMADKTLWIRKKKFRSDLLYRYALLKKIRQSRASVVINLIYSRSFRTDDLIAAIIPAPVKIAMKNDRPPSSVLERMLSPSTPRIYRPFNDPFDGPVTSAGWADPPSDLDSGLPSRVVTSKTVSPQVVSSQVVSSQVVSSQIDAGGPGLFDAYRNARFIGTILGESIHPVFTYIDPMPCRLPDLPAGGSYFIVFPGSGLKVKKWPAPYFAVAASHIAYKYRLIPVVCGSEGDRPDCEDFLLEWDKLHVASPDADYRRPIDFTGRTSLPDLLSLLKEAACLISADTGSVHLAAAVQCPVFGLFSGLHYGRFAPYPPEIAPRFYPVYPDSIDVMIADGSIEKRRDDIPVDLIKTIAPEKLIATIDESHVLHDRLVHNS